MTLLATAMTLLVASHVVPSAPGLRTPLIEALGRRGFSIAYSLPRCSLWAC